MFITTLCLQGPLQDPNPQGDIWVYDYATTKALKRVPLDGYPQGKDFHPLGIDVVPSTSKSPATLFAVNHGRHNTSIELFTITDTAPYRATYIRTLSHPAFVSPNSIAPISSTSFYVTNDHRLTRRLPDPWGKFIPLVETLLSIPLSWVDRVDLVGDEIQVTRVISGLAFANGISLSPDKKQVAVASTTGIDVKFYDVDESKNLIFTSAVPVPFTPDNVSYDEEDGSLIVAGHPHFPTLVKLAAKKGKTAPSWVVELSSTKASTNDSSAPYAAANRAAVVPSHSVTTLYQSDGNHFSSSTTGVRHGKDFFVAGLYALGLLHCECY